MHGIKWDAMKAKYRPMAVDAEDRSEFQNVVSQMLAELNASHLGIYGGRATSNAVPKRGVPTGYLGLEFSQEPGPGGGRVVSHVMKNGPGAAARLRVGDEILAINRKRLTTGTDLDVALMNTVDKKILVSYRPITGDGPGDETKTEITPVAQSKIAALETKAWLASCRKRTKAASKGRIAYIHLSMMNPENLAKFQQFVNALNQSKTIKGMIIDVRENGGGNIHQQLMQILTNKRYAMVKLRGAPRKVPQPALYWDKPVAVLVNERSFSDAEVFPWCFQSVGRGKVIGVPTPGGVIGTVDVALSDGTMLRIPRVGYYGIDGTNLEGNGVTPDIVVEETVEDRLKKNDPQLMKAVEVVLAEIEDAKAAAKRGTKTGSKKPDRVKVDGKPSPKSETPTPKPGDKKPVQSEDAHADPLADARVGEWVRYRLLAPGATQQTVVKVTVEEVTEEGVVLVPVVEEGPKFQLPLPKRVARGPLADSLRVMGDVTRIEEIELALEGDEQAPGRAVTLGAMGTTLVMRFTNALPAWGLHSVVLGEHEVMRAIAWGGAAAPKEAPKEARKDASEDAPAGAAPSEEAADDGPLSAVPNPLRDAEAGEWVKWRMKIQGQEVIRVQRVVEAREDVVVMETELLDEAGEAVEAPSGRGGNRMRTGTWEQPRSKTLSLAGRGTRRASVEVEEDEIEVAGTTYKCTLITITLKGRRARVIKRWISDQVPVSGVVREERNGVVVRELLASGRGAASG